jgi:hypothetical protein
MELVFLLWGARTQSMPSNKRLLQTRKKQWVRYAGVSAGRAVESRDVRWSGILTDTEA